MVLSLLIFSTEISLRVWEFRSHCSYFQILTNITQRKFVHPTLSATKPPIVYSQTNPKLITPLSVVFFILNNHIILGDLRISLDQIISWKHSCWRVKLMFIFAISFWNEKSTWCTQCTSFISVILRARIS